MAPRFCPKCGASVVPGSAFCSGCGTAFPDGAAASEPAQQQQPQYVTRDFSPQQEATQAAPPQPQPYAAPQAAPQQPYAPQQQPYAPPPQPYAAQAQQPYAPLQQPYAAPQQPYAPQAAQQPYAPPQHAGAAAKGKRPRKKAPFILGGIAVVIALVIVAAYMVLANAANQDYYSLGSDRIASIKLVVGKRPLSSTGTSSSNGVTRKTFVYSKSESVTQDLMEYLSYLGSREGFLVTGAYDLSYSPGTAQLAKKSLDEGQIIILDVEYDAFEYTLEFSKGSGTLEY